MVPMLIYCTKGGGPVLWEKAYVQKEFAACTRPETRDPL